MDANEVRQGIVEYMMREGIRQTELASRVLAASELEDTVDTRDAFRKGIQRFLEGKGSAGSRYAEYCTAFLKSEKS